jgi:aspartate kinase
MSADPKRIKNARKIPYISYIEAMELSYFGAAVDPRAVEPVMDNEISMQKIKSYKYM